MRRILLLLLLLPLFFSCKKELDFKYHQVESQFVIEGNLSENGSVVALSYTVPMNEPFVAEPIDNAEVTLRDLTEEISYDLIPVNGLFKNEIPGIPGHVYELEVNHEGKKYTSSCLMRGGVEILKLNFKWIKMPYDHVAVLEIESTVSDVEGACYWTRLYKNGEPYKWLVSHGSGAVDGKLTQTTFTTRENPDDEEDKDNLKEGDIISVEVLPVSLEMYDYLVGISSDSNGPAMFSGDFCLGYFLAAGVAESSITFLPSSFEKYYQ